jgi:HK97 family phage prohead protease
VTAPAQVPPPVESSNADEVIAALGALLLAGTTVAAVTTLLGTLKGAASKLVSTVFKDRKLSKLLGSKVTKPGQNASAVALIRHVAAERQAAARAAYMVQTVLRLVPAHATGNAGVIAAANAREDTFAVAHAGAAAHREAATTALIKAVGKQTPGEDGRLLMGWYADENPCPVCLLADGTDFDALAPPLIGWPGHVHPHCFCTAGAPHGTELMTDDVVSQRSARAEEGVTQVVESEMRALVLEHEARASGLQATKNGRKLWKWLTGPGGLSKFAGSPHPWQALVDFLVSKGVSPGVAQGEATNIMQATAVGKALFAKGHKGKHKKRGDMKTETRTAQVVELRGPGTDKPNETPGFTAKLVSYGVVDSYRTSWQKGVFTRALEQREADGHSIPVVWDHNWADPVGQIVSYRDEQDGFYADVEFDDLEAVPRAKQAHAQLRANKTTGKATMGQFSFAFARGEEEEDTENRGAMRQTSVEKVSEFSIVLNGSVPGTGPMAVRSVGRVDARTAADLIERFGRGEVDLTDALVELRSAARAAPAATFELRAITGADTTGVDPAAVLATVDAAMVSVADQLDKGEVEAARRYFSQAASRLSELQYMLGCVPGVEGYGESYAWRTLEQSETRGGTEGGGGADQAPEHEPFPERRTFELRGRGFGRTQAARR